jgi:hypothetical protein
MRVLLAQWQRGIILRAVAAHSVPSCRHHIAKLVRHVDEQSASKWTSSGRDVTPQAEAVSTIHPWAFVSATGSRLMRQHRDASARTSLWAAVISLSAAIHNRFQVASRLRPELASLHTMPRHLGTGAWAENETHTTIVLAVVAVSFSSASRVLRRQARCYHQACLWPSLWYRPGPKREC